MGEGPDIYFFIILGSGMLYASLIWLLHAGWEKIPVYNNTSEQINTKASVILPIRDEEGHLEQILDCLVCQDYPPGLLEIIVIDDHSTDESKHIVLAYKNKHPHLKYYPLPDQYAGKKQALRFGIDKCSGTLIITTDADCIMQKNWAKDIVSFYETNQSKIIVAPVILKSSKSFFQKFQELEFLSLTGTTGGAIGMGVPIMCNGANLAFEKNVYKEFWDKKNENFASGDDVMLLLKIKKKHTSAIHFLKSTNALVRTHPASSVKKFLIQRKRWTSKSKHYHDIHIYSIAIVVAYTNLLMLLSLIAGIFSLKYWGGFLILLLVKTIIDGLFLKMICRFFNCKHLIYYLIPFEIIYLFYASLVSIYGNIGKFQWKSRYSN